MLSQEAIQAQKDLRKFILKCYHSGEVSLDKIVDALLLLSDDYKNVMKDWNKYQVTYNFAGRLLHWYVTECKLASLDENSGQVLDLLAFQLLCWHERMYFVALEKKEKFSQYDYKRHALNKSPLFVYWSIFSVLMSLIAGLVVKTQSDFVLHSVPIFLPVALIAITHRITRIPIRLIGHLVFSLACIFMFSETLSGYQPYNAYNLLMIFCSYVLFINLNPQNLFKPLDKIMQQWYWEYVLKKWT